MDPEVDPEQTFSLRRLAQTCVEQFQQLSLRGERERFNATGRNGFWLSRQVAEFNTWCSRTNIHSEGLRSIDVRLKDVPEICDILLQLLRSLSLDLDDLIHQPEVSAGSDDVEDNRGEDDDDSESKTSSLSSLSFDSLTSSECSQPRKEVQGSVAQHTEREAKLRQHVGDTIERLHGQAKRIDLAGARHRQRRIEMYREKERPKQMYKGLKRLGDWKAKDQFGTASETVRERMAESFARRRIRFEYLKEHQKKRAIDMRNPIEHHLVTESRTSVEPNEASLTQTQGIPKNENVPSPNYAHDQRTLFSATVNTTYELPPEPRTRERAESVRSIALRHPSFPPPPQVKDGRFQCPYCLLEFRETEAAPDRWR
jgi:hypothetical protein